MFERNPTHILNDREIMSAIESGLIMMDNKEHYLNDKFIQPASQDVLLEDIDSECFLSSRIASDNESIRYTPHSEFGKDFVTFWSGYVTDVTIKDLKGFNPEYIVPMVELRSSLRRLGLCTRWSGLPFVDDRFTISILNGRKFPIIVEKESKISQLLWNDFFMTREKNGFGYIPHNKKISSGVEVTDNKTLERLIESGDIDIMPKVECYNGKLFFHASTTQTSYKNQADTPIVLYKDKRTEGLVKHVLETKHHKIMPGDFVDIQTVESIKLSDRVGMHVFYYAAIGDFEEKHVALSKSFVDRAITFSNTGGWIDPGYEGIFSVQRNSYTEPLEIKEGQRVAYATVYFFPDGVGSSYGRHRGSHYQNQDKFQSLQIEH